MNTRREFLRGGLGLSAILASGDAPAIVRSMVAARQSITASHKSLDYIQDGLVYINNPANPYFDGSRYIQDFVPGFTSSIIQNPFTIEFCATLTLPQTESNKLGTIFQFNNDLSRNALFMAYNGLQDGNKNCINWVCFKHLFGRWNIDNLGFSEFGKFKTMGFQHTANQTLNVFADGVQTYSNFKGNGYVWGVQNNPVSDNLFLMNGINGYCEGYLFSFRIYSRLITPEEVAYNRNVDILKFAEYQTEQAMFAGSPTA